MKLALIGYVWPEPTSSAAGQRTQQLLRAFQKAGWGLHVLSASAVNPFTEQLKTLGAQTLPIQMNDSTFDQQIREICPDIVIFDRFVTEEQFGWRVRAECPNALRVIDTQDLHFLRRARELALKKGASLEEIEALQFDLQTEDALREIASLYRSDLSLVLSDFELKLLTERFNVPHELLMLSRFHYPTPKSALSFENRTNFAWIGNFRHPPNADAIRWAHQDIWPELRKKCPTAEFHIYGAYPPKEFMELDDSRNGFRVLGPCEDSLTTLSKYKALLAPIRYGAGIKGKITDSWAAGTPVITTPVGAEGMHENRQWGGRIEKSPAKLVQSAIEIYESSKIWQEASEAGQSLLCALFDESALEAALLKRLEQAHASMNERRNQNVVGQILWHQGLRSTEYFSRWIETKNQFTLKS